MVHSEQPCPVVQYLPTIYNVGKGSNLTTAAGMLLMFCMEDQNGEDSCAGSMLMQSLRHISHAGPGLSRTAWSHHSPTEAKQSASNLQKSSNNLQATDNIFSYELLAWTTFTGSDQNNCSLCNTSHYIPADLRSTEKVMWRLKLAFPVGVMSLQDTICQMEPYILWTPPDGQWPKMLTRNLLPPVISSIASTSNQAAVCPPPPPHHRIYIQITFPPTALTNGTNSIKKIQGSDFAFQLVFKVRCQI